MKIAEILRSVPSLRANVVMGLGTGARILAGLVKTKIAALFLGATGLSMIGIGGQVQLLGLTWGSLSISAGFIRSYGAVLSDRRRRREVLATSFTVLCLTNLVMVAAVLMNRHWISSMLFGQPGKEALVAALLIAIPSQVLIGAYLQGVLYVHGRYDDWSRANAAGALVELGAFVAGTLLFGLEGAFWAIALAGSCWALMVLHYCRKVESLRDLFSFGFSLEVARGLAGSSLATSATSTFAYFSGMLVRVRLLSVFGGEEAGAYQAVCVISGLYTQLIMNGIWASLYPLAGSSPGKKELDAAWSESLTVTAGLSALFQSAILVAPTLVLTLFFSRGFLHATGFLGWQLIGDYFFLIAQPGLAVLLSSGRFREYATAWCSFYAFSVILPIIASPALGPQAVVVAYALLSGCLAAYSISLFLRRNPAIGRYFWKAQAAFGLLAIAPAFSFVFRPEWRLGQAAISALCLGAALLLFSFYVGRNSGWKTAVFNFGRKILLLCGLDSPLAALCARAGAPRWLAKLAPNHYQYPKHSRRLVSRDGFSFELDLGDFLDWHVYYSQMEGSKDRLYELAGPGDSVIDVGANIGETALHLARRVGTSGRVVAFEPDPLMRRKCEKNIQLNAVRNVRLEPYALADESRKFMLHRVSERNPAGNRIIEQATTSLDAVEVEAMRLDDYAGRTLLQNLSLLKIDVEGFEERVLRGAEQLIRRHRPRLFVELSEANLRAQGSSAARLLAIFQEWNYEVIEASTGRALEPGEIGPALHCDVICSPRPESSSSRDFT